MDLSHSERRTFYRKLFIVALAVIVLAGLCFVDPVSGIWVPKCPFRLLTGLNCPACGIQRFLHALLNGRIFEAIHYNYYLVYALPYAALFVVEWLMPDGKARERLAMVIENRYVVWFYVVTFFIWLVVRNILGI